MNYTNEAIKKAIEQGYNTDFNTTVPDVFLDPNWWTALGKAMGWKEMCFNCDEEWELTEGGNLDEHHCQNDYGIGKAMTGGQYYQHSFIDHLAEGKDPQSFFAEILK